ncbi:hypothetical protein RR46_05173 [Papilio xuthus]|uniref:Uncharacterized protein n=1 Tax=Papilio xuthus TaxID=66420 RepID=A0A194Q969_PAPXU|nr:hypothetical protein RR46_05173 [Papilio xuthus]
MNTESGSLCRLEHINTCILQESTGFMLFAEFFFENPTIKLFLDRKLSKADGCDVISDINEIEETVCGNAR